MSFIPFSTRRLPGIGGFVTRSPMFRVLNPKARPSKPDLIKAAVEAVREGQLLPGDRFPTPGEIAEITGASLVESLDAVSTLLKEHRIKQDYLGRLCVSRRLD